MRNFLVVVLLFGAINALLTSCGDSRYAGEIVRIDSLNITLDSCELVLDSLDMDKISKVTDNVMGDLNDVQRIMIEQEGTLDKPTLMKLSQYYAINSGLRKFKKNHEKVTGEIEFTRKQLKDLKETLESNLVKPDKATEYLKKETEVVRECALLVEKMVIGITFAVNFYDENFDRVEELLALYASDSTAVENPE